MEAVQLQPVRLGADDRGGAAVGEHQEAQHLLELGGLLHVCVVLAVRWLCVDVLSIGVCCRLTRAAIGKQRWERVEAWWREVNRAQPSRTATPNLVYYAALTLILASFILQFVAVFGPTDKRLVLAYHFHDQPARHATATNQSLPVLTSVEVRMYEPRVNIVQHDGGSGAILASVNSSAALLHFDPTLSDLLQRSWPPYYDALVAVAGLCIGFSWAILPLLLLFACSTCAEVWHGVVLPCAGHVFHVYMGVAFWLMCALPGLATLVIHISILSNSSVTVVGWLARFVYAASVVGSAGWLLALLSCTCARSEGTTEQPSGQQHARDRTTAASRRRRADGHGATTARCVSTRQWIDRSVMTHALSLRDNAAIYRSSYGRLCKAYAGMLPLRYYVHD